MTKLYSRWTLRIGAIAVLAGSIFALSAIADNYPGTNAGALYYPDANPHNACWAPDPNTSGIPYPLWNHLFAYMDVTLKNQTGIDVAWTTNCNNQADMRADNRLTDPTLYGLQYCNYVSGNTCYGSDIWLNQNTLSTYATATGFPYGTVAQDTWCHEAGHTLGLGHENGCMTSPGLTNVYSSHHVTHINSEF